MEALCIKAACVVHYNKECRTCVYRNCIVLYLYIYIALLAVYTNQKCFQCDRPREKRADDLMCQGYANTPVILSFTSLLPKWKNLTNSIRSVKISVQAICGLDKVTGNVRSRFRQGHWSIGVIPVV